MQLAWSPEDEAFRAELVAFLDAHTPAEMLARLRLPRRRRRARARAAVDARLAGDALRPRLDDPRLPARARRPQLHTGADAHLPRDARRAAACSAAGTSPATRSSRRACSSTATTSRRQLVARRDPRRHDLVHRHERAERRLRPRGPADARRGARRPLRRERSEGLDELRDDRPEVLLLRAHRSRRCRSTRASRCSSSTSTRPASTSGRCATSTAPPASRRCSSPT